MSSGEERKLRLIFYPHELASLKFIMSRYPIIEKNTHDKTTKRQKEAAWLSITDQFNAEIRNNRRTTKQLKNAWKRIKKEWKTYQASVRRQEIQSTGGAVPSFLDTEQQMGCRETGRSFPQEQMSLGNTHSGNDDFIGKTRPRLRASSDTSSKQSPDGGDLLISIPENVGDIRDAVTPVHTYPPPFPSDTWSTTSSEPASNSYFGINKLTTNVEVFEEDFHATRMAYLQEEHLLKMKVFEEELNYWQRMNSTATQCSVQTQLTQEQTSEQKTYHLLSGTIQRF